MTGGEHQRIAAAKADKYIGRDGSDPRPVVRNEDVATVARALSEVPPTTRHIAMMALARVSGLPFRTVWQMGDECPF